MYQHLKFVVVLGLIFCGAVLASMEWRMGRGRANEGPVASRYPLRTRTSGFYDRSKISNVPPSRRGR